MITKMSNKTSTQTDLIRGQFRSMNINQLKFRGNIAPGQAVACLPCEKQQFKVFEGMWD